MLDKYKNKEVSWLEVAPFLFKKQKEFSDKPTWYRWLKGQGFDRRPIADIMKAYELLKIKRPLRFKSPASIKCVPASLSYLPAYWKRVKCPSLNYEVLLDQVLDGKLTWNQMKPGRLATRKMPDATVDINIMTGSVDIKSAFLGNVDAMIFLIDKVFNNKRLVRHLRRHHGKKCHDLASKLESIFSEKFHAKFKDRKEFVI